MEIINQNNPLSKETILRQVTTIQQNEPVEPSFEWLTKAKWAFYLKANEILPDFKFDEFNTQIITNLIIYFGGFKGAYDLKKGIFLYGPLGSGKTMIMQIISEIMKGTDASFKFIPATQIVSQYTQTGDLDTFFRNEGGFLNRPIRLCIDEIGAEPQTAKYFGTEINVIQEVLQNRYYLHQEGIKTYITSNLKPSELGLKYGERIQDRANEMFNKIVLNVDKSRRK